MLGRPRTQATPILIASFSDTLQPVEKRRASRALHITRLSSPGTNTFFSLCRIAKPLNPLAPPPWRAWFFGFSRPPAKTHARKTAARREATWTSGCPSASRQNAPAPRWRRTVPLAKASLTPRTDGVCGTLVHWGPLFLGRGPL